MKRDLEDLLLKSQAPEIIREIANGLSRPPLTDYYLKPVPDEWADALPAELADGRLLVPILTDADGYSLYCVDPSTLEIFEIDIEAPWPPINRFPSWQALATEMIRAFEDKAPDSAAAVKAMFKVRGA